MMNEIDSLNDEELEKLEKRIAGAYTEAYKGLEKEVDDYFDKFEKKYNEKLTEYESGEISKAEFQRWYYNAVGRGERWKRLRDDMAERITLANETAVAYINNTTPSIFVLNANIQAYEIEKGSGVAFNLINDETIKELMLNKNHSVFKVLSVNPVRDYKWNTQLIQNTLLSGVLQGKSVHRISKDFLQVMERNKNAAIRNARTATGSARNAGCNNTLERATSIGIDCQKEWISTHDARTRDSHAQLDGVRVPVSKKFPNGVEYPCDPNGEPAEVYNCRCTMRGIIKGANDIRRSGFDVESYKEWKRAKESGDI